MLDDHDLHGEAPNEAYNAFAGYYDYVVPYRDRVDQEFFTNLAKESGGPVLEAGCGTGRILLPSARAGVKIVGLDASCEMLSICRRKLSEEPPEVQERVRLMEGDIRDFECDETFVLAMMPFRPFQHLLTVEDQMACLTCIHRHLKPEGRIAFDVFNPAPERLMDGHHNEDYLLEPESVLPDGRVLLRKTRTLACDVAEQLLDVEIVHEFTEPNGDMEALTQKVRLRYFFRFELEHLLARCGFHVERVYSDYYHKPFGYVRPGELLFVARKVGGD